MSNNRIRNLLWIIPLLVLILLGWWGITSINQNIQNALAPFRLTNSALSTQVSEILHPTPTIIPDPVTILHDVRSLARLETIQYSVEKIITAEVNQGIFGPLFGDRMLFVAHGLVIAGVDLEKLDSGDLWVDGNVLHARLPSAEVFVATLDNDLSYVYDRETGLLTRGDVNLETEARQAAEQEIHNAAIEDGILDLAQQNAEIYMTRLFMTVGYADVIFESPE